MAEYFSEELFRNRKSSSSSLNPEKVVSKLMYLRDQAHLVHFQTTSFEVHKTMDFLYAALDEWVDKIGELLLGYIAPKRFGDLPAFKLDSNKDAQSLINEATEFADAVYDYGEENDDWYELCNFAADLEGDCRKANYLLTLK
jgi:DNA-binding ferritin-like protein